MRIFVLLASLAATGIGVAAAQSSRPVSVLYAGSLVTPMEGPIKSALAGAGIDFQGEGAGSRMLANLIAAGSKRPDVFISVDPALVAGLGAKVASSCTFAGTSLGVGWTSGARDAALFERVAAGNLSLLDALETPGISIGRTDPRLDPKGKYTIEAMTLLAGAQRERRILGEPDNAAQTFPEEDLLARIETGQADVGFFYQTEAIARGLQFVALPGAASLSDKITYTLAVLSSAPHPREATAFRTFVFAGQGKKILQDAGLRYFDAACSKTPAA